MKCFIRNLSKIASFSLLDNPSNAATFPIPHSASSDSRIPRETLNLVINNSIWVLSGARGCPARVMTISQRDRPNQIARLWNVDNPCEKWERLRCGRFILIWRRDPPPARKSGAMGIWFCLIMDIDAIGGNFLRLEVAQGRLDWDGLKNGVFVFSMNNV